MKIRTILIALVLLLAACNAPASSSTTPVEPANIPGQPTELPPTPYPDTPAPAAINAPLIEAPALVYINMLTELNGWGLTETQVVRTNDGGVTWYNVTPPNVTQTGYNAQTFFVDNDHVWMQVPDMNNYPNSGTLYRTADGGITWTTSAVPFSGASIKFLDLNNGWALADLGVGAGSNAVAVFQTNDGGSTWNRTYINDPNSPDAGDSLPLGGLKFGITPLNMQTAWVGGVVYSSGTVYLYRTGDAGHTWAQVSLPLPEGAESAELSIEQVDFVSPTDAYLSMRMTAENITVAVYVSHDAGNTWVLTPIFIPEAGTSDFLSANEAVIYNGNQFYITRDAAHTWSIVSPDVVFGDTFASMDFVNASSGWVITLDPTNHRSLYRTSDGGVTWSPVIP